MSVAKSESRYIILYISRFGGELRVSTMDDTHLSLILATENPFSFIILGLEYPFAHLIEPYRPVKHHFHYFARSDSTSTFGHRPTYVRPNAIRGVPACHDTVF